MIKYFSVNDITRYLVLLVLLIVIRGFFLFQFQDPFLIELHYQGIAKQLSKLGESYLDVFHHLGPLAAGINRFFFGTLGDHLIYSRIAALLLCYIQVVIVSAGLNSVGGLKETNLFTGVIHIILLHLFPDMLILSPLLIGMTFIAITYILILKIIKGTPDNSHFLYIGISTSLAGGFMFPLFLFSIPTLLIIVIYTKFNRKSIGLYIIGLLLPILFIIGYYFFNNSVYEYLEINMYYGFSIRFLSQLPLIDYILVALVPSIVFVIAFFKILAMYNMINSQQKMIVASIFYLITGLVILALLPHKTVNYYFLFVPFLIHFYGILFIDTKIRKRTEIGALIMFAFILIVPFANNIARINEYIDYKPLYSKEVIAHYGKVLNLSEDKNILHNNTYATGFCEYMIAKEYFTHTDDIATIIVYKSMVRDLPDAIYDPKDLFKYKLACMPSIKKHYLHIKEKNIYKKIR